MCEPRRLTTLWSSTACYRDSFTLLISTLIFKANEVHEITENSCGCYLTFLSCFMHLEETRVWHLQAKTVRDRLLLTKRLDKLDLVTKSLVRLQELDLNSLRSLLRGDWRRVHETWRAEQDRPLSNGLLVQARHFLLFSYRCWFQAS
jgi:hypothetical protein